MQETLQIPRFHAECCKTQVLGPYHGRGGGGGSEPRTGIIYDTPLSFRITFYIHLLYPFGWPYIDVQLIYIIHTLLVELQKYNLWHVGWTLFFLFKLDMLKLILNVCCHLSQLTVAKAYAGEETMVDVLLGSDAIKQLQNTGSLSALMWAHWCLGLCLFGKRHPWIPWNYYCWWILDYCQTSFKAVVCDGWCILVLNIGLAKWMGRKEASETFESCWETLCSYLLFTKSSQKEI